MMIFRYEADCTYDSGGIGQKVTSIRRKYILSIHNPVWPTSVIETDAIEQKWEHADHKGEIKRISLKTSSKGGMIIIEVKDTGTGIPESILDKIFDPFFTSKEVGKGTGLGLSISYSIVQNYNGTINAETDEGEGSNFIIRFPVPDEA